MGVHGSRRLWGWGILAFIFLCSGFALAQASAYTGNVILKYNRNNGLNRFYLETDSHRYRLWIHILDPGKSDKEKILEEASKSHRPVRVTGQPDSKDPELRIEVRTLEWADPAP